MEFSKKLIGSTTTTLLLAVIGEKQRHGYEIVQRVEQLSKGAFRWREGTVYPALHRLEKQGLIVGDWQLAESGRQRRVYTITPLGQEGLSQQKQEWSLFASSVNRVLKGCHAAKNHQRNRTLSGRTARHVDTPSALATRNSGSPGASTGRMSCEFLRSLVLV